MRALAERAHKLLLINETTRKMRREKWMTSPNNIMLEIFTFLLNMLSMQPEKEVENLIRKPQ